MIGLANFAIFVSLSDKIELAHVEGERRFIGIHRSRATVAKLSALFGLDAFAGALGALAAASVAFFASLGLQGADAYRPLFLLYGIIGLLNLAVFVTLSDKVELVHVEGAKRFLGVHRSRATVAKLSALFALDSFAGGFVVPSIAAYWFYLRWGFDPAALGTLFFWVGILSGLSLLAAGWLAERIGLLNTMVLTHLPSQLVLILVPFMPTAGLAVALYLARMSVSQMDVPTRQSYAMAIVDPDERTATAGITNVARTAAQAVSPTFTGMAFAASALALPFLIAGGLKIIYDVAIYFTLRRVHPPEELARAKRRAERLVARSEQG
ncbi:MAG: hypothetical protein HY071_05785 [Chloroflexi bacterium]|nr:hypothetical protein [Chloroflexota bacterium]